MKISLYILFTLLFQTLFGQITYKPIFINQCTKKIENDIFWYLTDSTNTYGMENFEFKSIQLPKAGSYNLHFNFDNPIVVEITNKNVNRDTILLKRLELMFYVSNPPVSNYFDCGILANGKIVDLYANGKIRTKGVFKNGQPIDTLFEYHRNGKLSEIFIPRKKWKKITYFDNGKILSVYDTKKRFEMVYFQNGQLKKEKYWNRKYTSKSIEYFENGNVSKIVNKKELKTFNQLGIRIENIKRKEILVFDRMFAKNTYDRHNKFYEYKWETFDEKGTIKRSVTFDSHGFLASPFPDSINQIEDYSFNKISFYENGTESRKIEFKYVFENNDYIKKMFFYRKEEDVWIEEKTVTANKVNIFLALK